MKYIVYKTTCLINNKIYIGVHETENPEIFDGYLGRGFFINRNHYLTNPIAPFHYALIKHGVDNFKRDILHVFETEKEAYNKEEELVNEDFVNSSETYNVALGGKGRPRPKQPVYQFDFNGNLLKSYTSALEVSKIFEICISNIGDAINNKRTCKGFLWSYSNSIDILEYHIYITKNYYIYNPDGNLVNEFEKAIDVVEFLNTDSSNLSRAIKANYKVSGYFVSNEKHDKLQITISKLSGKLNRYSLEGKYIDSFKTVKEAKAKLELNLSSISSAIKMGKSCNGFYWTRTDNPIERIKVPEKGPNTKKKVKMLTLDGILVKIFDSVADAIKEFPGCASVLKGRCKQAYNYKFEYV